MSVEEKECIPCQCKDCDIDKPEGVTEEELNEWFVDANEINLDDFENGDLD